MLKEWFDHIEFAYTWALGLLLLVPVLIIEYIRKGSKGQASMLVTTTHFIGDTGSLKVVMRHLPFVLRCLAIVCLVVALARPQKKYTEENTNGEGIDIILCFDISGSMTERDFQPNRLEAAKEVASEFVKQRPGDRIGITIFSNQSFTLCPLTTDHNAVLTQIRNIQSGYLQDEGTAIGSGLATSVDRLRASQSKSKIVVLLTDGVDFGGTIPPDIARDMAKLYKVKVYTVGVGSEKEIEEVANTPFGPVRQTKKLEYNEKLLQDLATQTGAQYFHALDRDALEKIYASINQLEKSQVEITSYNRFTDEYLPLLLAGLALLLLEIVLRYTVFRKFP
ncbi:vWA domain-containing protein [Foetidibacter luteolus]|uniref:vWA domain-containing protein n=1 Tax=Foetidibacter luteolus TaxID=2608880 RepID=UPI00129A4AAE|nr:VWA domain-containing protein [Foetidibacter luteolus]